MVNICVLNICVQLAVVGCSLVITIVTVCVHLSIFKLQLCLVDVKAVGRPVPCFSGVSCLAANRLLVTTIDSTV